MKLYYHKTDGGAEYLTDKFIKWEHNGKSGKEGVFKGAKYIVRIDGDITKDAELSVSEEIERKAYIDGYNEAVKDAENGGDFSKLSY